MEGSFEDGETNLSVRESIDEGYEVICGPPHLLKLADNICSRLLSKHCVEDLMEIVSKNRNKDVFILASRSKPDKVSVIVDIDEKYGYSSGEPLFIPLPKKFAVLEPDKKYFERTLKANILLTVLQADEKELHR
ncbi:MAG TPA: hypothetical protein EYP30_07060 [Archaeoglobaceae archaeon]|nr:hypothetical protein [Archaeoglobaceae archaeon]